MTITFQATLTQAEGKQATGIVVPPAVLDSLAAGRRPAVRATVNGHEYRTTIGVMGGTSMIPVSAAVRGAAGVVAGDTVMVTLTADASPREVDVPEDFAVALAGAGGSVRAFFGALSNSLQRFHIDNINAAKSPGTRAKRIDKAVALFVAGKPR